MSDRPEADDAAAMDARLAARIATQIKPVAPPSARAAALRERVLASARNTAQSRSDVRTIAVADRAWSPFSPGVEICVLHEGSDRRSAMFRMSPGSFLFPHHHDMDEESVVLEGEAVIEDGTRVGAGDYQYMPAGTSHPVISAPNGCIVLVHGERRPRVRVSGGLISRLLRHFITRRRA
ncbi:MAG: cupin domain-containing protein [Gammaproteobacteria bacterium]